MMQHIAYFNDFKLLLGQPFLLQNKMEDLGQDGFAGWTVAVRSNS